MNSLRNLIKKQREGFTGLGCILLFAIFLIPLGIAYLARIIFRNDYLGLPVFIFSLLIIFAGLFFLTKDEQSESRPARVKLIGLQSEEPNFVKALVDQYGRGKEFKARDTFGLISDGYSQWYSEKAKENRVYLLNEKESATLELLEYLYNKGVVGNKRKLSRNEYGDEDWYYTLL